MLCWFLHSNTRSLILLHAIDLNRIAVRLLPLASIAVSLDSMAVCLNGMAIGLNCIAVRLTDLDVRMLDRQAPNIQVVADSNDNIYHETAIDTNRNPQHAKHRRDLINPIPKRRGPAQARNRAMFLQHRPHGINYRARQWHDHDVPVREGQLGQVRRDHLPNGIGIDKAGKDGKRHEVIVQNRRLESKISDDKCPRGPEGEETQERMPRAIAASTARADDVVRRLHGIEDEDNRALYHVPVREGEVVESGGNSDAAGEGLGDAEGGEHGALPKGGAAEVTGQGVDADNGEDALNRAVDDAQGQGFGMVFFPGLDVEGEEAGAEAGDGLPALAHVGRGCEDNDLERRVEGVDSVVEELAKGSGLASATAGESISRAALKLQVEYNIRTKHSRLCTINRVKGLVQKQTQSPAVIDPSGTVLVQAGVIPEQGQKVGYDKHEARQRNQVRGHAHREQLDDDIGVERLEDVARQQRVVDTRVLVLP